LQLFAGLRDIPPSELGDEVARLLKEVELTEAKDMRSASYSGGMRRRLSVAVGMYRTQNGGCLCMGMTNVFFLCSALIGDPKIVFLDEPVRTSHAFSFSHS
jgi:ABC-type multidrug transport system ATPase subunit